MFRVCIFKLITIILNNWKLSCILFQISCQKEYSRENCRGNKPPIENAGNNTSITLPSDSILLDGRLSSDPDDGIAGYEWKKFYQNSIHCKI